MEEKTGKPAVKERPMLFSAPMVRALLDGSKTQTRRVAKFKPRTPGCNLSFSAMRVGHYMTGNPRAGFVLHSGAGDSTFPLICPYGQPGDRLWVRETFGYVSPDEHQRPHSECKIEYRADLAPGCTDRPGQWPVDECKGDPERPRWRPSIHMPRAASRILLEIVAVRVERLNDCSDIDALAEGCSARDMRSGDCMASVYARLWESINGSGSWAGNPWVWVVEFKRVTP